MAANFGAPAKTHKSCLLTAILFLYFTFWTIIHMQRDKWSTPSHHIRQNNLQEPNLLVALDRARLLNIKRRRTSYHSSYINYYPNAFARFQLTRISTSGDIALNPGPPVLGTNVTKDKPPARSNGTPSKSSKAFVSIAHLNVRSLCSRENFYLVWQTITDGDYDIFTISETWLNASTTDMEINIPGYVLFRQDRGERKSGGGVAVYVKDIYKASVIKDTSSVSESFFQQLWLKVQCKKFKSFLLCTVYRPPNTPISFLEDLSTSFVDSLLPGLDVILLGDLNCNLLGDCRDGQALSDFCSTLNLAQLVQEPTRVTNNSQTLIDVALTTNVNIIHDCKVKSSTISDHSLVSLTLKLKPPKPRPTYITTRSYKNYNPEKFEDDLAKVPFHMISFFDDFDDQIHAFNCLFLDVLNDHAPMKRTRIKTRPNPYITQEIRQLMKVRDKWHKSAIKTMDKLHWNAYRFFRQEVKREIRIAEKEYVRSELLNSKGNSNSIWKVINRCIKRKGTKLITTEDPLTEANKFNEFYTSVGKTTAAKAQAIAEDHCLNIHNNIVELRPTITTEPEFNFRPVSTQEIEKIIKALPSNKAPGVDKVSARVLKASIPAALPTITRLINGSYTSNTFAESWKLAEVIPCPKDGDTDEPSNTRPISLLPILSKVCERSAHSQFVEYLDSNGKIAQLQSGNRKLHSTETALLHFTDEVLRNMDDKKVSVVVLLDMSKAFDSIRHDILLSKLHNIGVSNAAQAWFKSYLSNRKQVVRIGNTLSDQMPLSFGVPQGSILGPVLFTLYVNDLLSVPNNCRAMGYVDDTKLLLAIPPKQINEAVTALNDDLIAISEWCCANSLLLNPDKTKLLVIGVPQLVRTLPVELSITLLGKKIDPVPVAKDLGVIIDSCLNYNEHITKTSSSCIYKLIMINRIKHLLDKKTLLLLIHSFVLTKLFYCSTVWSNTSKKNKNKLQLVQNFAARIVLGLRKFDHISQGLRTLGWLNIDKKLFFNDSVMMYKCMHESTPTYLTQKFRKRSDIHSRATRHAQDLDLPKCRLAAGQRSFVFRGSKIWNGLPESIKNAKNIKDFKKRLIKHLRTE